MEIITVTLPAQWAPALINGDWSGLEYYYPDEAAKAKAWQMESGLSVLSCGEEPFVHRFEGLLTECLEYQCTPVGRKP
ncbi:hypothetical protein [Sulfuricystis multivorans]|uniref:hypothetical protein n=1 Tax=Sulfuricystis multivorans TaxID=2211108 RepID=UPI000F837457|nr:hypothetical protein [Sulfuricystis multivorans]